MTAADPAIAAKVQAALQVLRDKAFPPALVPNAGYYGAFECCETLVADAPRRLSVLIDDHYLDPAQFDDPAEVPSEYSLQTQFEHKFAAAVAAAGQWFGRAPLADFDASRLDEELHNFDVARRACWHEGDRLYVVQRVLQFGDGDQQLLLCVCAVPFS